MALTIEVVKGWKVEWWRRAASYSIGCVLWGCASVPCPEVAPRRVATDSVPVEVAQDESIAVVGDLQGTHLAETLFLLRENNHAETNALVCKLAARRYAATILLGDLVTVGESEGSWERFDELARRMTGMLLPVRGNHDYWGDDELANAAWQARFPWMDRVAWYSVRWGRIGLVFLNSNISELEPVAQIAQQNFYEQTLASLDADPAISGTVVFLHHPPFTENPNVSVREQELVRESFVAPLCRHAKGLAMVSGHAHGYERYAKNCYGGELQFIVSGGGGGPRPVSPPVFDDACRAAGCCDGRSRPLHFLVLRQSRGLDIAVHAIETESAGGVLEELHLPFHEHGAHAAARVRCGARTSVD